MIFLIPNFFYAIVLWIVYSQLPGLEDTAPFSKEAYLSTIGVIKYAPQIVFSLVLGDLVNRRSNKKYYLLIIFVFLIFSSLFLLVEATAINNLVFLSVVIILSALYEPALNMICAQEGEKKQNYLFVNNFQLVSRTSARFLAPLIFAYLLKDIVGVYGAVTILLVLFFIFSFFVNVPIGTGEDKKATKLLVLDVIGNIKKSRPVLTLTIVYCLFYLSVSYLEYFAFLVSPESEISLSMLFSILGAGFLFINVMFLLKKPTQGFQNLYLSLSLTSSSIALIILPHVPDTLKLVCVFIMGVANGGAVPVAMSIFQEVLKKEKIGSFIGFLLMSINLCAVLSMGFALLLTKIFSYEAVFLFDGIVIGIGAMLITYNYKKGYLNG